MLKPTTREIVAALREAAGRMPRDRFTVHVGMRLQSLADRAEHVGIALDTRDATLAQLDAYHLTEAQ